LLLWAALHADRFERVRFDKHRAGALADFNRPGLAVALHDPSRENGRGPHRVLGVKPDATQNSSRDTGASIL
jgi:hypothetical protein